MRTTILATAIAVGLLSTDLHAQRGRFGGRNRWRRPDEIQNRVAVYFGEAKPPAVDGDKVAPLTSLELVRAAAAASQVTLLYLHDGQAPEAVRNRFENALFRADQAGDELALRLRCFHCGRLDIAAAPALRERYGKQVPLFVAFDKTGKELKGVSMAGYKPDAKRLVALLDRAAKGACKPPLKTFADKYAALIEDLEDVLRDKEQAEADKARAGGNRTKVKDAERELARLVKAEQKLLAKEQGLLAGMRLPPRGKERVGGSIGARGAPGGGRSKAGK